MSEETGTEVVEQATPVETPGVEAANDTQPEETTVETGDTDDGSDDVPDEHPAKPQSRAAKRIQQLANERTQEREARIAAEAELAVLRAQSGNKKTVPDTSGKPVLEHFETYEEYYEALVDWKLDNRTAKTEEQKAAQTTKQLIAKATEKYPDFEEVALNPSVAKTVTANPALAQAISESDIYADVAYYLGQNVAEAKRIASLSPVRAIKEIAALEIKLKTPKPPLKTKTDAPPPIKPVTGAANITNNRLTALEEKAKTNPSVDNIAAFLKAQREEKAKGRT